MTQGSSSSNELTIDKIIEKFIPVVGAVFLTIGLGYLLYTSVWVSMAAQLRIGLGFFLSIAIIGGGFSFSDKLRYFADVTIGGGILLLYGTLIYGSRATETAAAVIPEYATLFTAFLFIFAIAYFASLRKSKVILVLGMVGSYLTPFVIGQNDVWAQNISFNAYLTYFAATNIIVFVMGKEISLRDIIPLNIAGLFFGTSSLYYLSYTGNTTVLENKDFFAGETFTAILLLLLVIFSIWSIIISSKKFEDKDESYLALGYLAPILWFIFNLGRLATISQHVKGGLYILLGASCFLGWHFLRATKTRFQHVALYAGGILCVILGFFAFIPDLNVYSSIAIAYSSLIFGVVFMLDSEKGERFVSYMLLSLMGAVLSMIHIFDRETGVQSFRTLFIIIALVPAMTGYFISLKGTNENRIEVAKAYSVLAFAIGFMFIIIDIFKYFNASFLIFYIPALLTLIVILFSENKSHDVKSGLLRASLVFFAIGYVGIFFKLVGSLYPAPADTSLKFINSDWLMIKGIFATIILFLGLLISRNLQKEQEESRPSFILVIFGYASLLLIVNYLIFALINDLEVPMGPGGPRAIFTTIWWIMLAIYMLLVGIRKGHFYRAEKLLGLLLLAITVAKIMFYDLATMSDQFRIIVMMIVGGMLMIFSYGVHTKGWIKSDEEMPLPKKKETIKHESPAKAPAQKKEFAINVKIKDIDISNIDSVVFEPYFGTPVKVLTPNMKKIVVLIVDNLKKTKFDPAELKNVYDTVLKNYESSLSKSDFELLRNTVGSFVESGGEVKIIKK